jgi:uncharacterized protein
MRRLLSTILILLLLTTVVSAAGGYPKIVDDADLITDSAESILAAQAELITDTYSVDVVIVTVYSLDGESAQDYADDYFDYNGYGIGPDYSGILLLISMEYREWAISTCGDCIRYFSDWELDQLFDSMSYDLSSGRYEDAFSAYLDELDACLASETSGDSGGSASIVQKVLISLLIGAIVGGIVLGVMRSNMNTAKRQRNAGNYLVNGSFHMYRQLDIFLYSRTTRTRKEQQSSGGSVHRSSSGRSHGGRSGRF